MRALLVYSKDFYPYTKKYPYADWTSKGAYPEEEIRIDFDDLSDCSLKEIYNDHIDHLQQYGVVTFEDFLDYNYLIIYK
jgi:hypothetical protein